MNPSTPNESYESPDWADALAMLAVGIAAETIGLAAVMCSL